MRVGYTPRPGRVYSLLDAHLVALMLVETTNEENDWNLTCQCNIQQFIKTLNMVKGQSVGFVATQRS